MIYDLEQDPDALPAHVNLCIVGSGPAGISLALRLLQKNPDLKVALLEGGGRAPSSLSQELYEGKSIGFPQHDLQAARVRSLGGTSNLWSGWCNRLSPDDFEGKSWIKDSAWPINYKHIQPYYKSAYEFFGVDPQGNVSDNNYAHNPALKALDNSRVRSIFMQHSFPAMNVGQEYEARIAKSRALNLYLNANVTNVNLTEAGTKVRSIKVTPSHQERSYAISADNYVLACGGVENARILLSSTEINSRGVGNDNDCVGRYFIDHLHSWNAGIHEFSGRNKSHYLKFSDYKGKKVTLGITPTYELRRNMELNNTVGYFSYFSESHSNARFQQLEDAKELKRLVQSREVKEEVAIRAFGTLRDLDSLILKLRQDALATPKQTRKSAITLTMYAEQAPNRNSRIQLSEETDRLGIPKPILNWQIAEQDYRSIRQSTLLIASELAKAGICRVQLHRWLAQEESSWPGYLISSRHPMGTTRMASSPKTGVVDANCRVHGVNNLYLSGSSVFPTGGYANPTLTIVALSQRLADHLSSDV